MWTLPLFSEGDIILFRLHLQLADTLILYAFSRPFSKQEEIHLFIDEYFWEVLVNPLSWFQTTFKH